MPKLDSKVVCLELVSSAELVYQEADYLQYQPCCVSLHTKSCRDTYLQQINGFLQSTSKAANYIGSNGMSAEGQINVQQNKSTHMEAFCFG